MCDIALYRLSSYLILDPVIWGQLQIVLLYRMCIIACLLFCMYSILNMFFHHWLMQCNTYCLSLLSANHLGASGYHSHAACAGWSRHGAAGLCSSSSEGWGVPSLDWISLDLITVNDYNRTSVRGRCASVLTDSFTATVSLYCSVCYL